MLLRRTAVLSAALLPAVGVLLSLPTTAFATTSIRTDAATVGGVVQRSAVLRLPAAAQHVAAYWRGEPDAQVTLAFSRDGRTFGAPVGTGRDEVGEQRGGGTTYGAVQVAGGAVAVRVTTDRPLRQLWLDGMSDGARTVTRHRVTASASAAVPQPTVLSRAAWGADESLRFNADGSLKQAPAYATTKKLVVHHTDTTNADPDPAATLRAIYRYHVVTQGWADIGYQFLVDESGRTWEGRWSRAYAAGVSPSGDDATGRGVTGSHTAGWNTGTVGVALLGTLVDRQATSAARTALVELLAWQASRHGLDPQASTPYTNPSSGAVTTAPNVASHRDYVATDCPGGSFYSGMAQLRADVTARVAGSPPPPSDTTAPSQPTGLTATPGSRRVTLAWQAATDAVGVTGYVVQRSTTGKPGSFVQVATPTGTTWTDTAQKSGRTLWYSVMARDAAGNTSAASAVVSARVG